MATDLKRFTISVTNEMVTALHAEKRETYYEKTQSEMIRDLINRGLASLEAEKAETDASDKKRV